MLRLTRLTIHQFRDCAPTTLHFGRGPVFLLGSNGGGKTTLLELLSSLASSNLTAFESEPEALDLEWVVSVEGQGAEPAVQLHQRARLAPLPEREPWAPRSALGPWTWTCSAWVREGDVHVEVTVTDGQLAVKSEQGWELRATRTPFGFGRAIHNAMGDLSEDPPARFHDAMEPILTALPHVLVGRIDEALGCFESILGAEPHRSSKTPWIAAADSSAFVVNPTPPFAASMTRLPLQYSPLLYSLHKSEQAASSAPGSSTLIFPEALRDLLKADVECSPKFRDRTREGVTTYVGFDFHIHWPDGSIQSHDRLSFGQKRLLAILWFLACERFGPVFTDELSNGLHASWIVRILQLLGDQQAFHATQNPLLLDLAGPGPEGALAERIVRCEVELVDGRRRWTWRNPTEAEATRISEGYAQGFQHLSEVLQSEGLW
jgi:hypothetical protein